MQNITSVEVLDIALRGAAVVVLLMLAALLVREYARTLAARLGAAFACGVAAYAVSSSSMFTANMAWWKAPIIALALGNTVVFWLFARALFDDGFKFRWWYASVWVAMVALGLVQIFVLLPTRSAPADGVRLALSFASLFFASLAVSQSLVGWRADLIEGRRRLRMFVVGTTACYIAVIGVAELILRGSPPPALASAANAVGLVAMAAAMVWPLLRVAGDGLFANPSGVGAPDAAGALFGGEPPDPKLVDALERLMTTDRIYRQEALTIATLAVRLGLAEYKLRRLINQGLGYRNFNAFLNRYRINEAKTALADPAQAEVPILTIAMDAGYRSLGPFNRAFKAEAGVTPSDFRRDELGKIVR